MKCQQPVFAGALDLRQQFGVPPDVIDVERDAKQTGTARVQPIADIERLFRGVDAGAVGGIGRVQRFDRQRHTRGACVIHHFGDGVVDLRPCFRDILGSHTARPRILRQPASHQHHTRRAKRLGLIDDAAVVVARFDPMRGIRSKHAAAAIT